MKGTWVSFAVTLSLGAIVMFLVPYRALTPGTLRDGHLAQKNDCFSCHTLFAGAPAVKCSRCHRPGEIGLRLANGEALAKAKPLAQKIHQAAFPECAPCHTEHGGRLRPDGMRRFSHELLPAAIGTQCTECHAGQRPADALHAAVSSSCSPCHSTKGWKPATWNHDRSFRFDRNHPTRCADCHPPGTSLREYRCTGCHEHALDVMQREHREEGITNLEKCRRCHPSGSEDDTIKEGGRNQGSGRENDDD